MERRAEINRFAIFLFCLLVPLGSLAPTETSERKMTTEERRQRFTTDIQPKSKVIHDKAHNLFEFYKDCVSATFHPDPSKIRSEGRDMAETVVECPAFQANCCVLHHIRDILKSLENEIETICNNSRNVMEANLIQLNTTLRQGTAFYTCKVPNPPQVQTMNWAERKTYIWWVLEKYDNITQTTFEWHSRAADSYARIKK